MFRLQLIICYREQRRWGERMTPTERRQKLLELLCIRRHDTCDNLAHEFHVSSATIRRDIAVLTCSYPIETVCERYGGGGRVADGILSLPQYSYTPTGCASPKAEGSAGRRRPHHSQQHPVSVRSLKTPFFCTLINSGTGSRS